MADGAREYAGKARHLRALCALGALSFSCLAVVAVFCAASLGALDGQRQVSVPDSQTQSYALAARDSSEDASAEEDAQDSRVSSLDVPHLVNLVGCTRKAALKRVGQSGTIVSKKRLSGREDAAVRLYTVALSQEETVQLQGTPLLYLYTDSEGLVVRAGYRVSLSLLGYGSISFRDAVESDHVVEDTLAQAGLAVEGEPLRLAKPRSQYATYEADGVALRTERARFSGTGLGGGQRYSWEALVDFDYTLANSTDNLANTVRHLEVYVGR